MPARPSSPASSSPGAQQPVHAFRPTSGTVLGVIGLVVAGAVIVLVLVNERNVRGLEAALIAGVAAVLIWMVLLRPRVTAYSRELVLRNMASDTYLPLAEVDGVVVRHQLNVWVGGRRFTCPGIGRSTRSMVRDKGRGPVEPERADYATFVENTIEELARSARRDQQGGAQQGGGQQGGAPSVRRKWAVPELGLLGALSTALVLTLLIA